ncbi:MAG TPA: sortase [Candidatus Saccharimonadales bacterium]|nr:sortase [Candidatus Saccharimonadales bacterium]
MNNQDKNLAPATGGHPASNGNDLNHTQAADVARQQISQIYNQHGEPNQTTEQKPNPYAQTHTENFDWTKYHSAWQEYYQEYYRRYYAQQQQQPLANQPIVGGVEPKLSRTQSLKADIKNKVKERAQNFKKSHHFWPIITAVAVGFIFLLIQFNGLLFAQVRAYVSPGELEGQSVVVTNPAASFEVGPEPRLIIPKINVDVPVVYGVDSLEENAVQDALQEGVVHYNLPGANSVPGQRGNGSYLGHSSNDVFAGGDFKFALLLADNLMPGDTFFMHYQGVRYTYKVTEKKIINPDEISALQIGYDKPMATLITCTPPGTALKRLLIYGEQISPDPATAVQPAQTSQPTNQTEVIPGNSPTLFEQLFGWLF